MDVQRLPILGVFSTLLKMLLMYSVIWKFRRPFLITFAACFCRPARKNLPAHPMPRRVILMYVADNASLVLSGLDKVKALGNLKPVKRAEIQKSDLHWLQCHCLPTFPMANTPNSATLPALEKPDIFFVFLEWQ